MKSKMLTDKTYSRKDYKDIRQELAEYYGINPTLKQLANILAGEHEFATDYFSNGKGMDTFGRELLVDAIGKKFAGRKWPINAESDRVSKQFFKKLFHNLKSNNIKVEVSVEDLL